MTIESNNQKTTRSNFANRLLSRAIADRAGTETQKLPAVEQQGKASEKGAEKELVATAKT